MPLVEGLLPFLKPIRGCLNLQNRDDEEFVIPFAAPRLSQHQMKSRGFLNHGASTLVEPRGTISQPGRVTVQFLCECHNGVVQSAPPNRIFTQPRARGEVFVHLAHSSLVAEKRQTKGRKLHSFQTTPNNLERRKFLSDEKNPFALCHCNRDQVRDRL